MSSRTRHQSWCVQAVLLAARIMKVNIISQVILSLINLSVKEREVSSAFSESGVEVNSDK